MTCGEGVKHRGQSCIDQYGFPALGCTGTHAPDQTLSCTTGECRKLNIQIKMSMKIIVKSAEISCVRQLCEFHYN